MHYSTRVSDSEFRGASFGDERLSKRVRKIAKAMEESPAASFPTAMTRAELEACYRFMSNKRVDADAILAPHRRSTVERMVPGSTVVAVSDTTTLLFNTDREGLGESGGRKLFAHVALAIDSHGTPLGVLDLFTWARTTVTPSARRQRGEISAADAARLPNEHDRWWKRVEAVEATVGNHASVVHVMDSEAEDYKLLHQLVHAGRRFVIRCGDDRRLESVNGSPGKMSELVASCPVRCVRTVKLSPRKKPRLLAKKRPRRRQAARDGRDAELSIGAVAVRVCAPSSRSELPKVVNLNVVCVREDASPEDAEPVEWTLLTTEPIDSEDQMLSIVDMYRHRWKVEELFKALKTGCAIEQRQFGNYRALANALALTLPIAWNLLRLRTMSRSDPELQANAVLSDVEITVLREFAEKPLPENPTLVEAMLAIARKGGHLQNNGPPGWLTLGRGYLRLLDRVDGYLIARRCDQS